MIRINKRPIKHASIFKITKEMFNDKMGIKYFLRHFNKQSILYAMRDVKHKNVLKISFDKKFIGLHDDDFAMNLRTVRVTYKIITFKR